MKFEWRKDNEYFGTAATLLLLSGALLQKNVPEIGDTLEGLSQKVAEVVGYERAKVAPPAGVPETEEAQERKL